MKIFISQGYSYDPKWAYECAKDYSRQVAKLGHMPISPVLMFHHVYDNGSEYHKVLYNCFALIKYCDELWVLDNNGESKGVCAEIAYAETLGKPVRIVKKGISISEQESAGWTN